MYIHRWLNRAAFILALAGFLKVYVRWRRFLTIIHKMKVPVHSSKGFTGSLGPMMKNFHRLYDFRLGVLEELGDTSVWTPAIWSPNLVISTRDPANVKHILGDKFNTYVKSDSLTQGMYDLLGRGIFGINHGDFASDKGEDWYFQRKTASRIFTKSKFKGHVHDVLVTNTNKIIRNIEQNLATSQPFIFLQTQFYKFTLDTIGCIGFGVNLDTLSKGTVPFSDAFDVAQLELIKRQMTRPGWRYLKWLYPAERKLSRSIAILDDFCNKIVDDRLALSKEELAEKGDILSLFVQSANETDSKKANKMKSSSKLSKRYLRDIIMSFFIAGRDTTACTLSFTFLILAQHPEIQEKLYEEIISHSIKGDFITIDEMKDMDYLDGVIRESLRLFPPVPSDSKQAAQDDVLPDGTVVPKGCVVAFEVYSMGRDEKLWSNPERVEPERWFLRDGRRRPTQYEFPVFQAGPRICLGKDLALYEAKMVTTELLRRYRFELAEALPNPVYAPSITLSVNGGLKLKVHPR